MRHRNKVKKLDRMAGPRKALLRGLVTSMIENEAITTTEARAKVVRPIIERLITKGKVENLTNLRSLKTYLYTAKSVKKVLKDLSPRFLERKGGYTRIIKLGFRQGDGAKMSRIEFVA